jgi:hypothetical protein
MTLQPLIMLWPLEGHAKIRWMHSMCGVMPRMMDAEYVRSHAKDDGCRVCADCRLSGEDRLALADTPVDHLPPSFAGACCFTLRSAGVHMLAG